MLKLIIEDDEGKTTVVPLIRDEITIGRKEGNTIRLTERNVSRRHAKLRRDNGGIYLEDLNSYNGTKVNGSRVTAQVVINEGDRIQIGDYQLALKLEQPQQAAPSDPFEEMKTVPMEKSESEAMAQHLATVPGAPAVAAAPAADDAPTQQIQPEMVAQASQGVQAAAAGVGRLVVISSNFGGMEFRLDKAAQVIGRTPDNDIVVDHRSISRHHAKIVQQGNSYTIIDQVSSNGIYVNGEKYDRVELRAGDVVDLGHVRLRFVGADEPFTYDPSLIDDIGLGPKQSKMGLYTIIGVVVVVIGAVGILAATGAFSGKKKTDKEDESGSPPSMMQPDAMGMDMGQVTPPMGAQKDYEPIHKAILDKNWVVAITKADAFLKEHPDDSEAKKLRTQAKDEIKHKEHRDRFYRALRAKNLAKAVEEFSQIHKDSVYFPEILKRAASVKNKLKRQYLKRARKLHRQGKCDALRDLEKPYKQVDPDDVDLAELIGSCKSKTAVADGGNGGGGGMDPAPRRRRPPPRAMDPDPRPRVRPMARPPAAGGDDPNKLTNQAQSASMSGQCGKAIRLATKSNRIRYSTKNVRIIGFCGCKIGRKSKAKWAYRRLSSGYRAMLMSLCRKTGITLP